MTDYTQYGVAPEGRPARHVASAANWLGAGLSLALVAGVGVWGYKLIARDVSGVPVVQAAAGPMREAPEDPGGLLAMHQGLAVNRVAGIGTAAPPAERLVLAPTPAGLGEEDVALGLLPQDVTPVPAATGTMPVLAAPDETPLAPLPELATVPAGTATAEAQDPIRILVEQLAAGVAPLSELAPQTNASDIEIYEGPGLARSLRPRLRPQGLQVAALGTRNDATPTALAAVSPGSATLERDPDSLAPGTRLVQIGAFDSPETARAEWQRLEARFGDYLLGKDRVIQRATSGGRVFYRLRAHGFVDLSDARRFCAAFVAQNVDCIPVVTR